MQQSVLSAAAAGLAAVAVAAGAQQGAAMAATALVGGAAGFALYHASFGFTAAWRRFARERRGAGLRAQMLLIGLACLATFPLMHLSTLAGIPDYAPDSAWTASLIEVWRGLGLSVQGAILPMGLASAVGAFAFGVGMQVGGGCASGTLFTVGGGSTRMVLTLLFFVIGSVWSTAHYDAWGGWPTLNDNRGVSLLWTLGLPGAMAAMAALLAAIWLWSARAERRAHGALETPAATRSLLTGPWSMTAGAVALAVVCVAMMLTTGRPWGVTWAFALWGGMGAEALGVEIRDWTYWSGWRSGALDGGLFGDVSSVSNFGIVFGAMAAAALAGKWAPVRSLTARDMATAVIGGLLMGWGARMAYGCNIGAYLGGLTSGSLHGLWWLAFGYAGSLLGVRVRALLAMDPPLPAQPARI
jgi:uncharacterized membrane protein YedE/YeeE